MTDAEVLELWREARDSSAPAYEPNLALHRLVPPPPTYAEQLRGQGLDLVVRLRAYTSAFCPRELRVAVLLEAADEIERLRRALAGGAG